MIWATGFKTNDFMLPMEITGSDGVELREHWSDGAHAHLGIVRSGLPEHVRDVRAQHEHLGRLDPRLPRGAGRLRAPGARSSCAAAGPARSRCVPRSRPPATARCRRASPAPHGPQCDSWYRDEHGRIVANWPGYMREYLEQTASWMWATTSFAPLPDQRPPVTLPRVPEDGEPMHDYVIVGAGSAGCVLANRLSEDPSVRVLLLEAGGKDRSLKIKIPAAFPEQFHTKLDWDFATEPEPHVDGRSLYIPRGKMLGGSSSMNAMLYVRGRPLDYDGWEAQGAPGWGYADVLPYFIKAEDNVRGAVRVPRRRRSAARHRAALAAAVEPAAAGRERGGGHPPHRRLQRPRAGRRVDVPGHPAERATLQRRRRLPAPGARAARTSRCARASPCSASSSTASARSACALRKGRRGVELRARRARGAAVAPARSARRSCCCCPESARPRSCARPACRRATSFRASVATCRTTRS